MAIGAQFAAALQALLEKLQQSEADIKAKEDARRLLYTKQETGQMEAYPLALRSGRENMSDRGLAQSGIGLGLQGKINRAHTDTLAGLVDSRENDLRDLANARLAANADYKIGYGNILKEDALANATTMAETGKGYKATPGTNPVAASIRTKPPAVMASVNPGAGIKPRQIRDRSTLGSSNTSLASSKLKPKVPPRSNLLKYS